MYVHKTIWTTPENAATARAACAACPEGEGMLTACFRRGGSLYYVSSGWVTPEIAAAAEAAGCTVADAMPEGAVVCDAS